MNITEKLMPHSERSHDQSEVLSANIRGLLHDFKLAIVTLAVISAIIQFLLHVFVPGI